MCQEAGRGFEKEDLSFGTASFEAVLFVTRRNRFTKSSNDGYLGFYLKIEDLKVVGRIIKNRIVL